MAPLAPLQCSCALARHLQPGVPACVGTERSETKCVSLACSLDTFALPSFCSLVLVAAIYSVPNYDPRICGVCEHTYNRLNPPVFRITLFLAYSKFYVHASSGLCLQVMHSCKTWRFETMAHMQWERLDLLDGIAHHESETRIAVALFSSSPFFYAIGKNYWIPLPGLTTTSRTIGFPDKVGCGW